MLGSLGGSRDPPTSATPRAEAQVKHPRRRPPSANHPTAGGCRNTSRRHSHGSPLHVRRC